MSEEKPKTTLPDFIISLFVPERTAPSDSDTMFKIVQQNGFKVSREKFWDTTVELYEEDKIYEREGKEITRENIDLNLSIGLKIP